MASTLQSKGEDKLKLNNEEIKAELLEILQYIDSIKKDDKQNRYKNAAVDGVLTPVIDNEVATMFDKMMFHTTSGRTAVIGMMELVNALKGALTYIVGTQINAIISYILDQTGRDAKSLSIAAAISFVLLIVLSIYNSFTSRYMISKLGGTDEIYEDTDDDLYVKKFKNRKKIE